MFAKPKSLLGWKAQFLIPWFGSEPEIFPFPYRGFLQGPWFCPAHGVRWPACCKSPLGVNKSVHSLVDFIFIPPRLLESVLDPKPLTCINRPLKINYYHKNRHKSSWMLYQSRVVVTDQFRTAHTHISWDMQDNKDASLLPSDEGFSFYSNNANDPRPSFFRIQLELIYSIRFRHTEIIHIECTEYSCVPNDVLHTVRWHYTLCVRSIVSDGAYTKPFPVDCKWHEMSVEQMSAGGHFDVFSQTASAPGSPAPLPLYKQSCYCWINKVFNIHPSFFWFINHPRSSNALLLVTIFTLLFTKLSSLPKVRIIFY